MTVRETYEKEVQTRMSKLNAQIKEMVAEADQAGDEAKKEYRELLSDLNAKQVAAQARLQELKQASNEAWEDLGKGMGRAVNELQDAVSGASSRLQPQTEPQVDRDVMMQFREGAQVFTARGERVGEVERVVLNPDSKEISHVVVRKGLLFTTAKVVPLSLIDSATPEGVMLHRNATGLEELPDFEETHYIPVEDQEVRSSYPKNEVRTLYGYSPAGVGSTDYGIRGSVAGSEPKYVATTEQNIPEEAVALKEGAKVISSDDKHVGDVKSVLTGPQADRVTHFVIERGLLLKEEKLVPIDWVSWMGENEAHLTVGSQILEALPAYL